MCERAASDFHRGKKSNFRVLEVAVPGRARHHKGVVVRALSFRSRLKARPKSSGFILICGARSMQFRERWFLYFHRCCDEVGASRAWSRAASAVKLAG